MIKKIEEQTKPKKEEALKEETLVAKRMREWENRQQKEEKNVQKKGRLSETEKIDGNRTRGKKRQLTGSRFTDQQQKTEENDAETPRKISKLLHNNCDTTPKHRIFENSGKIAKLGLKKQEGDWV